MGRGEEPRKLKTAKGDLRAGAAKRCARQDLAAASQLKGSSARPCHRNRARCLATCNLVVLSGQRRSSTPAALWQGVQQVGARKRITFAIWVPSTPGGALPSR